MYIYERKAHYHETDQMGVIHHSNYLRYMEEARIELLDSVNLNYKHLEEIGIISPIVSVNVEYKKPIRFDDIMQIKLWVSKYTGVSFEIEYEIVNKETQELCIKAHSKSCFVKNNRVVSIKKECPDIDNTLRENIG
ncbi:MAG: acyl-CoA thioesterase [Acholeplasmatales bacterium]|nr:acyl-CoA thioesterase [Acholeplasmatales bacterium]